MKAAITSAIALTALVAFASPARAQGCEEGFQVCGFVWNDYDGNGIQDDDTDLDQPGDQSGIDGATVTLKVWNEMINDFEVFATTETSLGFYSFDVPQNPDGSENPLDGLYKVVVDGPSETKATLLSQGTDYLTDNDGFNDTGGAAAVVCLLTFCPSRPELTSVRSQEFDFGFTSNGVVAPPGTGTPGYWKNHPEAWPSTSISIGGITYTQQQALAYMGKVSKDKRISLFTALVAAKLNVAVGNDDSCIASTIADADAWMAIPTHQLVTGSSPVAAASADWQQIAVAHESLDDYNNGRLPCAQHRN